MAKPKGRVLDQKLENRRGNRSNVFLTATLDSENGSVSVHIRNLSPSGVLLEADTIPEVGSRVRVSRGELTVAGELVWQGPGQGGVNFDQEIDVRSWVRRVAISGRRQAPPAAVPSAPNDRQELLSAIRQELEAVRDELADMPAHETDFAQCQQRLSAIAQTLRSFEA